MPFTFSYILLGCREEVTDFSLPFALIDTLMTSVDSM